MEGAGRDTEPGGVREGGRAVVWRTDNWQAVSKGVDVSSGVKLEGNWLEILTL